MISAWDVNKIFKKSLYELCLINPSSYIRLLHEEKLCWKNYYFFISVVTVGQIQIFMEVTTIYSEN